MKSKGKTIYNFMPGDTVIVSGNEFGGFVLRHVGDERVFIKITRNNLDNSNGSLLTFLDSLILCRLVLTEKSKDDFYMQNII